jgi:hypothetical protein
VSLSHLQAGEVALRLDQYGQLIPTDEESVYRILKMVPDKEYVFTMKRPRNIGFHRKYFSLLKLAFENQDKFDSPEWFREHTLIAIGHHETRIDPFTGQVYTQAKTLSFGRCSQAQFEEIYNRTLNYLVSKYGYTKEFVEELISYG